MLPVEGSWRTEYRLEVLLNDPDVMALIEEAAQAGRPSSAKETIEKLSKIVDAVGGLVNVPTPGSFLQTAGWLSTPLRWVPGNRVRRTREQVYLRPIGEVTVAALCAFLHEGHPISRLQQTTAGCLIEAPIPRNWLSWKGKITCVTGGDAERASVGLSTRVPGQLFDFGRSRRILNKLVDEIGRSLGRRDGETASSRTSGPS